MRHWLLTSTTYGTWLPGDPRGSVTSVRDYRPSDRPTKSRVEHSLPGEPWEPAMPGLYEAARAQLKAAPVLLNVAQAQVVLGQFLETAAYRGWQLLAVAIMANHFHLVVRVKDDPDPKKIRADFKAYASGALNREFGKRSGGEWWTQGGSKRKLVDERAVKAAIRYVLEKQPNPLVTWSPKTGERA